MRKKTVASVVALALAGAGGFAAAGIAGGDQTGAERTVLPTVDAVGSAEAGVSVRASRPAARARRRAKTPLIQHFYAPQPLVPPDDSGRVQGLRCPGGFQPIGGAAQTSIGIVLSYLSRRNPVNGRRPNRTYFIGVDDITDSNLPGSGAVVEVICAKNLRVKR